MTAGLGDTIVAVSSPPGQSPRGLLRLSGAGTNQVLTGLLGDEVNLPPIRQLTICRLALEEEDNRQRAKSAKVAKVAKKTNEIFDQGDDRSQSIHYNANPNHFSSWRPCRTWSRRDGSGNPTIPVLIARFANPQSYTGQDMAELQLPGNPALLDRVLHRCINLGARLAEPGEFTFRAFVAGKLDLTQAEGVAATIAAVSDAQLQAAALLREGRLGSWAAEVVDELANLLALVEAGIDFVDQDDVTPIAPKALAGRLIELAGRVDRLLGNSRSWGAIEALPRVVLVGPPNAGKSTLFNALLGRERAVISPVRGTTRDILAEPLTLEMEKDVRREVMLVDIAGLDSPLDALDEEVQAAARRAIAAADLLLFVDDGQSNPPRYSSPAGQAIVRVRTKAELAPVPLPAGPTLDKSSYDLSVSACTGQGLDELRHALASQLGERAVSLAGQMLVLQPRHETAIRSAAAYIDQSRTLLNRQTADRALGNAELIAGLLRQALDDLACLGGTVSADDLIGRVFAAFCIGK